MSDDELVPYDLSAGPERLAEMPPGWKFRNLIPRAGEPELSAWLRRRISERLYLAQHTIELGNAETWTELSSGVLMTIAPDAPQDSWDGIHALGDSSLTRLMEANDPQDTITRCDAELEILDLHSRVPELQAEPVSHWGKCRTCWTQGRKPYDEDGKPDDWPCRTVRLLGSAYRHCPGYKQEWAA